jgi:peptidyl-prolyl cis-trans isomerase C
MHRPAAILNLLGGCLAMLAHGVLLPVQAAPGDYDLAAKVNGIGITLQKLESNFEEYLRLNNVNVASIRYPDRFKLMKRETLDLLIDQELLWQAANENEVTATADEIERLLAEFRGQFSSAADFTARLAIEGYTLESYRKHLQRLVVARKYLDQVTSRVVVSEAEVHDFYTENPESFRRPETVRVRHILVKVPDTASDDVRQVARQRIETILAQARAGADFADLARRHSEDATAPQGGELGYFPRGKMVKSFEQAAFALQPGQLSDVVESPFGLHVIKLEDRRPAQRVAESQVRDQLTAHLQNLRRQQAEEREMQRLRADANIEILVPL